MNQQYTYVRVYQTDSDHALLSARSNLEGPHCNNPSVRLQIIINDKRCDTELDVPMRFSKTHNQSMYNHTQTGSGLLLHEIKETKHFH